MSVEILLLVVLAGITLLSYMVAINSHGPTRLSISYLIATVILAGTVWVTVQYVNNDQNARNREELKRLELEKNKAEEQARSKDQQLQNAMKENKDRAGMAAKLNAIISSGNTLASQMINTDLRDQSLELDALVGRAADTRRRSEDLATEFGKIAITDNAFSMSATQIKDALTLLTEASQYFVLYYKAEDSAQEELRERIMRSKARTARENLEKASAAIAAINTQ
ncbi:MAG TPA: hypothetical protein VLX68_12065 [Chitinivibrionales bacterium]|nr:hypothetical protein [Chitinivibrionales bacterium]